LEDEPKCLENYPLSLVSISMKYNRNSGNYMYRSEWKNTCGISARVSRCMVVHQIWIISRGLNLYPPVISLKLLLFSS